MEKVGNVTIRKRSNGKYEYRFEIEPIDGKRRWKSKGGFLRKKEAQTAGNAAREEYIRTGGRPERKQDNISVNALAEIWLEKVLVKREPTTYASYKNILNKHILPVIGQEAVKQLDYSDIEALLQKMADGGCSKSTLEVTKAILSGMFGHAIKPMRLIRHNPAKEADLPESKKPKKERIPYTSEQVEEIFKTIPPESDYRLPLVLGIYCGLRISEALGLTWDCVDLKAGTITVNKQLKPVTVDSKTYYALKKPKSKTSCRTIHVGPFVMKELLAEKKRQAAFQAQYGSYYYHVEIRAVDIGKNKNIEYIVNSSTVTVGAHEIQLVCRRENGCSIVYQSIIHFTRKLSEQLGYKVDPHTGRHTHATLIAEYGGGVAAVSARLGHSSPATTMQYVHSTDNADIDAMERFEVALSTAE